MSDIDDRLDRLESLVEQQQETIEQQRERIADLETRDSGEVEDDIETVPAVSRRGALTAGGLLALLFGGVGTASADAQGQVGTSSDPLDGLYTDDLYGNNGTITVRDALDLANSDSIQDAGTEAIQFDGNQNITIPNGTLDLNGNDVRLTEDFNLDMQPGLDTVEFKDTNNSHTTLRIGTGDPGVLTLMNANLRVRNSNSITDNFGDAFLTINSGGPLGVNKTLDLNSNNVEAAASIKGGLTGGTALTDLQGTGIRISGETLGIEDGGIDTAQLASGAVGSGEIASGAVGSGKIADNAVGAAQINIDENILSLNTSLYVEGLYSSGDIFPETGYSPNIGKSSRPFDKIYANSVDTSSDERLKENIHEITNGLDRLQNVRPVSYERKDRDDRETELGFIAQELEDDIPEVVNEPEDADGWYGLNYSGVIPVTVEAIQELAERFEHLRERVEELEQQRDSTERIPRAESGKRSARIDSRGSKQDKSGTASRPVTSLLTHLRDQNADLEARLDRIEAHLGIDQPSRQGVTDD